MNSLIKHKATLVGSILFKAVMIFGFIPFIFFGNIWVISIPLMFLSYLFVFSGDIFNLPFMPYMKTYHSEKYGYFFHMIEENKDSATIKLYKLRYLISWEKIGNVLIDCDNIDSNKNRIKIINTIDEAILTYLDRKQNKISNKEKRLTNKKKIESLLHSKENINTLEEELKRIENE